MGFSVKGLYPEFTEDYITVRTASEYSGYNQQYLRRLLRGGGLKTKKIGQIWLINQKDFVNYLYDAAQSDDKRFGPQTIYN